jgi:hypothetical protein
MATWTGQSQTPALVNAAEAWKQRCMAIVRFAASDWPAVQALFQEMMKEVLSRMMQEISEQNR